jgi:tyrosyl-tRNA synthetase
MTTKLQNSLALPNIRYTVDMRKVVTDATLIDELLTRSIDTIYPSKESLRKQLLSGRQLKVYVGIDPTADYVHLGHSTNYIVLKRFHELGHKITVLVGDFTALIGDPSDKTAARYQLTAKEVATNLKTFKEQIGKILDFKSRRNPVEFMFNSKWLSRLSFKDAVELASNFTVQQMIERDAFQKRLSAKKPLYVHEFFYPLMQGYDSVAMDVDVEVGGTDQTFNMLAGRTLLKRYKNKEKFVLTTTLLENPKTGEKLMSKSLGTGIGLNEAPQEMYAKVMALPDEGIIQCFTDCTYLPQEEITKLVKEITHGNPRDTKLRLADEVVKMYHGEKEAEYARNAWIQQFSLGNAPEEMPLFHTKTGTFAVIDVFTDSGLVSSKSEAKRLLSQKALRQNGQLITDTHITLAENDVLQAGKRRFVRVVTD